MSTTEKMPPARTIWMRYGAAGATCVIQHQVWDKARFLAARADECAAANATLKPGQPKATAEQISEADYKAER